ncbi:GNAT family N-acetyltransferase [Merismopedia glauca]|uniref:GNAT family N-acetyltransferase n=1 Tax=Merismopedia glauca CCAP 1448/3 TaxID=1296344 RepID=A0A2T1C1F5_9CYAN|nr:GNAT family N-acetyltransferase [Merismopedia glauca]PSB02072.1 GNAT family N-acetyltransferase [Merismopedia glauca CCAP 1448/3]
MSAIARDAVEQDFDRIASLAVEAYREYSHSLTPHNWDIMRTNLSNVVEMAKQGRFIVAEQGQEIVGSVAYCTPGTSDKRLFQPEWASVRMLAVLPQYRGQGIGQILSLECINRAKQDKAEVIALHTSELMVTARRMYERLGFKQDIQLPQSFGLQYWRYVLNLVELEAAS